jgi:hypothetical protein
MSKHTPGPWQAKGLAVDSAGDKFLRICQMSRVRFTEADRTVHEISDDTAEANARLISAAPDLLEALEEYVRDFGDNEDYDSQRMAAKARAAIAKATG